MHVPSSLCPILGSPAFIPPPFRCWALNKSEQAERTLLHSLSPLERRQKWQQTLRTCFPRPGAPQNTLHVLSPITLPTALRRKNHNEVHFTAGKPEFQRGEGIFPRVSSRQWKSQTTNPGHLALEAMLLTVIAMALVLSWTEESPEIVLKPCPQGVWLSNRYCACLPSSQAVPTVLGGGPYREWRCRHSPSVAVKCTGFFLELNLVNNQ